MNYVGIKNCMQKSTLVKYALKKGNKVTLQLPCVTANDCQRHFEVLKLFDKKTPKKDFRTTMYYQFNKDNGQSKRDIFRKIKIFQELYNSMKRNGYDYACGYIILTQDGARLDGSHRASIIEHLGYKEIVVLMVRWEDCFRGTHLEEIREHLKQQKQKYDCDII